MNPSGSYGRNVKVIGYCGLEDRPAFKMAIREARGRWYLYAGHFWRRGWSIVEVTDPMHPTLLHFSDGPDNTFTLGYASAAAIAVLQGLARGFSSLAVFCGALAIVSPRAPGLAFGAATVIAVGVQALMPPR